MKKKQTAGRLIKRLGRSGALKRNMPLAVMLVAVLAALMANYAFSAETVYDRALAGGYVDVGIDTARGIKMDLVEKGLTHKVLEFEITNDISAQDIQLLIAENNFDAKEGSLSKFSIATRNEPVYETSCTPYMITDEVNGSEMQISNCTTFQTGTRIVEYEEWLPVELKSSEENADSSLATFNLLEKGKYRYSFDTPIIQSEGGWGNAGTVFLKLGSNLYADKQHSSWWNTYWFYRVPINISNPNNYSMPANFTINLTINTSSLISAGKLQPDCDDLRVVCGNSETNIILNNETKGTQVHYGYGHGCADTATWAYFSTSMQIPAFSSNATECYLYYGNSGASKYTNDTDTIFLAYDDFEGGSIDTTRWTYNNNIVYNSGGYACADSAIERYMVMNFSSADLPVPAYELDFSSLGHDGMSYYNAIELCNLTTNCAASIWVGTYVYMLYYEAPNEVYWTRDGWSGSTIKKYVYDFSSSSSWSNISAKSRYGGDGTLQINGAYVPANTPNVSTNYYHSLNQLKIMARQTDGCIDNIILRQAMNAPIEAKLEAEEANGTGTEEGDARAQIVSAIQNQIPSAIIYTDQQIYTRYLNGSQMLGTFDKIAVHGNQRWAFNYVTGGESYTRTDNLAPALYIWENSSLAPLNIYQQVQALILSTKA